jgi:5'/3'-nucleotidase SurE
MKILLTNDDSHQSPFLKFAIDNLSTAGELTIVVPEDEQSWKGKSMTCVGRIEVKEIDVFGSRAFSVNGTPSDCVNLGIYHLFPGTRPDLVVSGINAGPNSGSAFIFSSGTVNACLEANLADIPALALSQDMDTAAHREYAATRSLPVHMLERLEQQTRTIFSHITALLQSQPKLLADPITWNLNFPYHAAKNLKFVPARVAKAGYGSFFVRQEQGFAFAGITPVAEEALDTDVTAHRAGNISVTRLDIHSFGQAPAAEECKMWSGA